MEKAYLIKKEGGRLIINKRQLKIRLIFIFVILIATYLIGELMVRAVAPQELYNEHAVNHPNYKKEVEYDNDLGWSLVKNYNAYPYTKQGRREIVTITHNSKGFRMNHEVDESKDVIVITGDSLAYGFWVDDKKVVSAKLNEMLGTKYEVINLAVGGYGTDQGFLRFIRDGLEYKPKVVIHTLFNNDFSNIVANYQYNVFKPLFKIAENGTLILTNVPVPVSPDMERSYPKVKEHAYKGFKRFMYGNSHLYTLYKNKMPNLIGAIKGIFKKPEKIDYFTDYKDGELWVIEKEYTDITNYAVYLNSLILKSYDELAKRNNITFILAVIGDRISVDPEMQKATVARYYNIDENFFDYEKIYNILDKFSKDNGIKIVNLYPVFKKEFNENKKDMYLEGDHHLNDYGHELFAKEVYNLMVKEGLV